MIPAEAVRAAFIAIYERDHIGDVGSADIRRALEAAAPHMLAEMREALDRVEAITNEMDETAALRAVNAQTRSYYATRIRAATLRPTT